jgi:hypothetical protein
LVIFFITFQIFLSKKKKSVSDGLAKNISFTSKDIITRHVIKLVKNVVNVLVGDVIDINKFRENIFTIYVKVKFF